MNLDAGELLEKPRRGKHKDDEFRRLIIVASHKLPPAKVEGMARRKVADLGDVAETCEVIRQRRNHRDDRLSDFWVLVRLRP